MREERELPSAEEGEEVERREMVWIVPGRSCVCEGR